LPRKYVAKPQRTRAGTPRSRKALQVTSAKSRQVPGVRRSGGRSRPPAASAIAMRRATGSVARLRSADTP
jgi:hypothetical protein